MHNVPVVLLNENPACNSSNKNFIGFKIKKKTIDGEKHFTVSWKISRENCKDFLLLLSICNKLIQTFWALQKKAKTKKNLKKLLSITTFS